jgi:hypothetical protein
MKPIKLKKLIVAILFLSVVIIFLSLLTSCSKYTLPKAEYQVNKAYLTYPPMVATKTRDWFPCIVNKNDTIITYVDSLIYIDCPSVVNGNATEYISSDTVYINKIVTQNKVVKVPHYIPIKTITVVQKVEDSAKIFQLNDALLNSTNETAKANDSIEKLEAKIAKKNKYLLYLLIALLASLGVNYLQFKRK